ncbi:hypothetical protein LL273_11540 [Marinobacter salarius]|uniref:hypothetical protein n=1 Tax=Marinobacter salarius TaxID=1420917 RepID=UPI001D1965FB|nr:hypothetical protein [Marinobacter salarius]MCC4284360.1 hypothetical protein [Marinobacter salarius]
MLTFTSSRKLLSSLKRAAKDEFRSSGIESLSFHQNKIARTVGCHNWASLLGKIESASPDSLIELRQAIAKGVTTALPQSGYRYAQRDVVNHFEANFEQCAEFSAPDGTSENGYSHPSINVESEVMLAFSGLYSKEILRSAAVRLEELGPWCLDDSDLSFEYEQ